MEFQELKNKDLGELNASLADSREKLRELRFKDSSRQLKNIREIRVVKKSVAKIMTAINAIRGNNQAK